MTALDLLSDVVPVIKKGDSGTMALEWMDEFKVSHLPIVVDDEYIGLVSEAEIYDMPDTDASVVEQQRVFARPFVRVSQHILEILDVFGENRISVIPVLDASDKFVGSITLSDLSAQLPQLASSVNRGAIIVLDINVRDYSLSQIAQIVEGNDAKIVSLYVHEHIQPDRIYVTIKLNRTDVSPVIQTFERYNYDIVQVFSSDKERDTMLEDRYNLFMKYLNV